MYYARQKGEVNAEELAELTAEIEKKKVAVEELKREVSGLAARKTALAAEPTDADLVAAVEEMSKATHADRQRLAELKKTAGSLSPKKLKQIKDGWVGLRAIILPKSTFRRLSCLAGAHYRLVCKSL